MPAAARPCPPHLARRRLGWRATTALAAVVALAVAGCADDRASTSATSTSAPASTTSSTAAPVGMTTESSSWDLGRFTLGDGTVSEDWGVVAVPTTGGPYPVAMLLHGSHTTCPTDTGEGRTWPCPAGTEIPNQEGLAYLADALAARGFVAIAPGVNAQYTLGSGEPMPAVRTAEIAARALAELRAGQLGVDPSLVDAERLVMVGHSVGGQDASLIAAGRTSFDQPVEGVVMLQPALNASDALPLADVPAVVVLSECDGDTGVRGGQFVSEALLTGRAAPAALVVLEHANHNATNSGLRADPFPVQSPGCAPDRVLDGDEQRALLAEIVPELAHAVAADGQGSGWAGDAFDDAQPPAGVQLAVVHAGEPVAAFPGPGPALPAGVALDGMTATFCPIGYYTPFMEPGTEPCHRPELPLFVGLPQTVAVSWTAPGAAITVPLDAAPGDRVLLRAAADVADPALEGTEVDLHVTTPEGLDEVWTLPVPEHEREEIQPFTVTHALVMWSTATFAVPDGASAVTITVASPGAGSVQLVSVGVVPAGE